jgi:hypothetical protein
VQGAEHSAHERDIDHRGLVNDQQIAIDRRVLVAPKADSPRIGLEQAMAGLLLDPGARVAHVLWYVVFIGAFLMIAFLWMLHMELTNRSMT